MIEWIEAQRRILAAYSVSDLAVIFGAGFGGIVMLIVTWSQFQSGVALTQSPRSRLEHVWIRRDEQPVRFFWAVFVNCLLSAILIFLAFARWFVGRPR